MEPRFSNLLLKIDEERITNNVTETKEHIINVQFTLLINVYIQQVEKAKAKCQQ